MKKSILLLFLAISNVVMSQTGTLSNEGIGKQSLCVDTKGVPLPAKALRVLPNVIGSDEAVLKYWEHGLRPTQNVQIGYDVYPSFSISQAPSYLTCIGNKCGQYIISADFVFLVGSDSTTINYPADKSYFYYFNEEQISSELCDCLSKVHPNATDIPKDRAFETIMMGRGCLYTFKN